MSTTELRTPRLLMRRARPGDLDALHRIMSDPETMRYWSTPPHESLEETRAWLDSMIEDEPSLRDDFIIEQDGEVIGKLGGWRMPEIGFFLRRDRCGQGLASEALAAFISHAASCGHDFLTADVDPENGACLKLLDRAGFKETGRASGTWQVGDRLCNSVYLRLEITPAP